MGDGFYVKLMYAGASDKIIVTCALCNIVWYFLCKADVSRFSTQDCYSGCSMKHLIFLIKTDVSRCSLQDCYNTLTDAL